jgi:hypothetical protein
MATDPELEDGPSPQSGDAETDAELDEALEELESAEASRKRFGLIVGLLAIVLIVAAVLLLIQFRDTLLVPKPSDADLEKAAQKNLDRTDDPQCRRMIAEVTDIQNRFFSMESRFETVIPDGDIEETRSLLTDLRSVKSRLLEAEELSKKAALRFDRSKKELKNWFDYINNEILILEDILVEQLARRMGMGQGPADAGTQGDVGVGADTGISIKGVGTWEDEDVPPADRRNRSLVALNEAFDSFRVWHSGYEHPCGSNAEDEEPWRPPSNSAQGKSASDK